VGTGFVVASLAKPRRVLLRDGEGEQQVSCAAFQQSSLQCRQALAVVLVSAVPQPLALVAGQEAGAWGGRGSIAPFLRRSRLPCALVDLVCVAKASLPHRRNRWGLGATSLESLSGAVLSAPPRVESAVFFNIGIGPGHRSHPVTCRRIGGLGFILCLQGMHAWLPVIWHYQDRHWAAWK